MSLYPMERHGFVHPDSWHDEYRRIDELFDTYLEPGR
jgi:dipeptidyl aminopeptidase/acylaminoacyl peptidase